MLKIERLSWLETRHEGISTGVVSSVFSTITRGLDTGSAVLLVFSATCSVSLTCEVSLVSGSLDSGVSLGSISLGSAVFSDSFVVLGLSVLGTVIIIGSKISFGVGEVFGVVSALISGVGLGSTIVSGVGVGLGFSIVSTFISGVAIGV